MGAAAQCQDGCPKLPQLCKMEAWLLTEKFWALRVFFVFVHWFIRIENDSEQDTSRSEYRLWSLLNLINLWLSALHLSFGKVWAQVSQVSLVHHCTSGAPHGSTCTLKLEARKLGRPRKPCQKTSSKLVHGDVWYKIFCLVYPKSMCMFSYF